MKTRSLTFTEDGVFFGFEESQQVVKWQDVKEIVIVNERYVFFEPRVPMETLKLDLNHYKIDYKEARALLVQKSAIYQYEVVEE
ncbi:hypothetical protein [Planctobacterium marinum]|uniref:hypothetical protein n=1 Tax=Planctobacterium marinum TaxID=1631968 RepID=UPI0030C7452A